MEKFFLKDGAAVNWLNNAPKITTSKFSASINKVQNRFLPFFWPQSDKERSTKSSPTIPLLYNQTTYGCSTSTSLLSFSILFAQPSVSVPSQLLQRVRTELFFHRTTSTFLSDLQSTLVSR